MFVKHVAYFHQDISNWTESQEKFEIVTEDEAREITLILKRFRAVEMDLNGESERGCQ
jgi:hypothetical protein